MLFVCILLVYFVLDINIDIYLMVLSSCLVFGLLTHSLFISIILCIMYSNFNQFGFLNFMLTKFLFMKGISASSRDSS